MACFALDQGSLAHNPAIKIAMLASLRHTSDDVGAVLPETPECGDMEDYR